MYGFGKSNERPEVVGFCGLDADRIKRGLGKGATALLASYVFTHGVTSAVTAQF